MNKPKAEVWSARASASEEIAHEGRWRTSQAEVEVAELHQEDVINIKVGGASAEVVEMQRRSLTKPGQQPLCAAVHKKMRQRRQFLHTHG